jgi:hypothetical protein
MARWHALTFSADDDTREIIEAEMERIRRAEPGYKPNISATIRSLILAGKVAGEVRKEQKT